MLAPQIVPETGLLSVRQDLLPNDLPEESYDEKMHYTFACAMTIFMVMIVVLLGIVTILILATLIIGFLVNAP